MNHFLSDRINTLAESQTLAMSRKTRELKSKGFDIIALSLGEPDFFTPDFVKEAAKTAIDENYTKYMAVQGYEDLREAISDKFKRENGLDYKINQIVVSTGAKQSLTNTILSLVNPGEEVIIPAPYWVSYVEMVKLAEGVPVILPTTIETDFKITPEQLEKAITAKSKLFVFSSPCNPTGSVYSMDELKDLAAVFSKHKGLFVISDEIYEYINFSNKHVSMASIPEMYDQTITVNGVSKGFAMTGWRVGYLGAPQWIADACTKMQGQFTSGTCSIAQRATKKAVEAGNTHPVIQEMKKAFLQRRDLMIAGLNEIPGMKTNIPDGAFYLFPDISAYLGRKTPSGKLISTSSDLSLYLLEEALVATVDGIAFGSPECLRISYAASEKELIEALERIKLALKNLV